MTKDHTGITWTRSMVKAEIIMVLEILEVQVIKLQKQKMKQITLELVILDFHLKTSRQKLLGIQALCKK